MELLRNSSFSVTEIADLTGISGVSYFSELFRQKTGHSPREYRKRILEKSV
jgi:AraC-like DNA-binding protein